MEDPINIPKRERPGIIFGYIAGSAREANPYQGVRPNAGLNAFLPSRAIEAEPHSKQV
jgi:hypothetical protein